MNLSTIQQSLLASSPLLGVAFICIPATMLARSFGGRIIAFVCMLVTASCLFVCAAMFQWVKVTFELYPLFIVMGLLIGSGTACVNCGLIQMWWFQEKYQGSVVGVFLFATTMGPSVFGAFAEPFLNATSIQALLLFWGLNILVVGCVAFIFGHDPPYVQLIKFARGKNFVVEPLPPTKIEHFDISQDDIKAVANLSFQQDIFPERRIITDIRKSLTHLRSWCVILIADVTLGCYLGFIVWIPFFFLTVFSTDGVTAGLILMGYGISGSIGAAVAGPIIDFTNIWISTAVFLICSFLGFTCLAASTVYGLSIAGTIWTGFFILAANTACYKLVVIECPDSIAGCMVWMECFADFLAFALPLIFGAIFDAQVSLSLFLI